MENINFYLQNTRQQYDKGILAENQLQGNPLHQFEIWMKEAIQAEVNEPNAMDLCTVNNNKPSTRIVLLKGVSENGFIFFTNYNSRKGTDILANPNVSINFFWQKQARQVRIEGIAEKVSQEDSDSYYKTRPRDSQIGAWASAQSNRIKSRNELEENIHAITVKYSNKEIPRPAHWGGFLVKPSRIEFWQGRPNRLHDRFLYELHNSGWSVSRLAP